MTPALYTRRAASADDNMIPLINIVFLLLIFFMIAGKIASDDALQLTLPQAQQAAPAPALSVEILVDRDGRIALDGVVVSVEQLAAQLAGLQQRGVNTADTGSGLAVALKADAQLPAGVLAPVLNTLRAAGIDSIHLYTRRADAEDSRSQGNQGGPSL